MSTGSRGIKKFNLLSLPKERLSEANLKIIKQSQSFPDETFKYIAAFMTGEINWHNPKVNANTS
jgi:hypothetical protein